MKLFRLNNGSWTDDVLALCHFETVKDVNDDDFKAVPKEDIPKGTRLEDAKVFLNCYGTYVSCQYKGKHYNVKAAFVKAIPTKEGEALVQEKMRLS